MFSAIDESDLRFHLVHEPDGGRIGYQKFCKAEEKPVPDDEIVKAFEVAKDKLVVLTDEDFEAAKTEGVKTIEISDFVPYEEIDPIYFERTYYLGPQKGGEKVYALLREAMEKTELAAIGKYVMRDKQHLGCLRVREGVITLEKMFFHDEIRPIDEIAPKGTKVAESRARDGDGADRAVQGRVQAGAVRGHLPRGAPGGDQGEAEGQDDRAPCPSRRKRSRPTCSRRSRRRSTRPSGAEAPSARSARPRASGGHAPRRSARASLRIVSPLLKVPGSTTFAHIPRRRRWRYGFAFTNLCASTPKRALNFTQPVCGGSVTSITAVPSASRVPGGRFSSERSRST